MRRWFPPAAVMVLAIVVNSNMLANGFVFDDVPQILQNPWLRDTGSLTHIFSRNVWGFAGPGPSSGYYRPLMHLLNMASYQAFGQRAWKFHLISLLLHAVCTLLVWLVIRTAGGSTVTALWAELLFAVHPIHTEPVAWIAATPDLAYSLLTLLALLLHIRGRPWWTAALFLPALLAKETAIVLPLLIVAWEWQQRREMEWLQRIRPVVVAVARFGPALAIYLLLRFRALHGWTSALSTDNFHLSPMTKVYSAFYLLGKYLWKSLEPLPLNVWPSFRPATSPVDWRFLAGLAAVAAAIALGVALWRRKSPLWIAVVWILGPLLPALWIGQMGETTFGERNLYLPSAGICWLAGAFLGRMQEQPGRSRIATLYGGLLVAVCAIVSWTNAPIFHDDVSLWEHANSVEPDSLAVHGALADAYLYAGDTDRALDLYKKAVADEPNNGARQVGYGVALATAGHLPEARAAFERASALLPDSPLPLLDLGMLAESAGDTATAERYYRQALEHDPQMATAHRNLGALLLRENRLDEAEIQFRAAGSLIGLGQVLAAKGHWHEAEDAWRSALRRAPDSAETWYLLGHLLKNTGRPEEAARCFAEMRRLLPHSAWQPPQ